MLVMDKNTRMKETAATTFHKNGIWIQGVAMVP